ncbi:aldose 1-epimerase family protein [Sphingomonas sp. ASV193]|uniref:aldose 1-epimerase family protein n=1 Tax=Sphingomonas sp. ASV193 TaxID=3144405 RepID=UPI0032E8EC5A
MPGTEPIIIRAPGGLSAAVNPIGAELWWLRDPQGRNLQWDGDPAFWTGRAPILFPIVGRLNDDRLRWRGETYRMEKHGFARRRRFAVEAASDAAVTLVLAADAESRAQYPFDFALRLIFAVEGASLSVTARVDNPGDEPLPFSFGFHPALRWPLPFGQPRSDHRILFARDEPEAVHRIGRDGLLARTEPTPIDGRELILRDALFEDDALLFLGLESRSVTYGADQGPRLRVDFPGFPDLGVWTKPGAGYVCIEPWHGYADPHGFEGEFDEKPGIMRLDPGATWRATMTITLEDESR